MYCRTRLLRGQISRAVIRFVGVLIVQPPGILDGHLLPLIEHPEHQPSDTGLLFKIAGGGSANQFSGNFGGGRKFL